MQKPRESNQNINNCRNLEKWLLYGFNEMILKLWYNSLLTLEHIINKHLIQHELLIVSKKIPLINRLSYPQPLLLIRHLFGKNIHNLILLTQLLYEINQLHKLFLLLLILHLLPNLLNELYKLFLYCLLVVLCLCEYNAQILSLSQLFTIKTGNNLL